MRRADLRQVLWEGHLRVLSQEFGAQVQVPEDAVKQYHAHEIREGRIGKEAFAKNCPKFMLYIYTNLSM